MRNDEPAIPRDPDEDAAQPRNGPHQGQMTVWLSRIDQKVWDSPDAARPGLADFARRWTQILHRSFIDFLDHDASGTASSLTYSTLLSIVPLLALLMAGLTVFGVQKSARDALKNYPLIQNLAISKGAPAGAADDGAATTATQAAATPLASAQSTLSTASTMSSAAADDSDDFYNDDDITTATATAAFAAKKQRASAADAVLSGPILVDRVFDFVDNANLKKLGPFGFVGLFWAFLMLLSKIERAMNRAWSVQRERSWSHKVTDYLNILIVGVLMLLALTTTTSSKLMAGIEHSAGGKALEQIFGFVPVLGHLGSFVLANVAYVIIWPAFMIIYAFIPNTVVRWRSAVAGGFVAGTLYQLTQILFIASSGFLWKRYGTIYGSFAILFVMFFWIYISWMIVLWGAEVCAAHQNLRDLRRRRREWLGLPYERETLALRLASLLAAPMIDGGKRPPMDAGDLADALCCPPDPLHETIELFRANGLLVQSADDLSFRLARSPESVSLLDVLRLVRQGHLRPPIDGEDNGLIGFDVTVLAPLQARCVSDLARLPLDRIHALKL